MIKLRKNEKKMNERRKGGKWQENKKKKLQDEDKNLKFLFRFGVIKKNNNRHFPSGLGQKAL